MKGLGIEPPVELSSAVIRMRSTFSGERVLDDVFIKNITDEEQILELLPPSSLFSWLKISPTVLRLEPGQAQRVEVDFNPPPSLAKFSAESWYKETLEKLGVVEVGKEGEESKCRPLSPFDTFVDEGKWTFGRGPYGSIQWSNDLWNRESMERKEREEGSADREGGEREDGGEVCAEVGDGDENIDKKEDEEGGGVGRDEEVAKDNGSDSADYYSSPSPSLEVRADLEAGDWGILGEWNIPILVNKKEQAMTTTNGTAFEDSILFLKVQTVVNPPEVELETTEIDFGQSAVGVRMTKMVCVFSMFSVSSLLFPLFSLISLFKSLLSPHRFFSTFFLSRFFSPFFSPSSHPYPRYQVKIRNCSNRSIHFQQVQLLNALGPFSVLNFVRELRPGAIVPLLFNCEPTTPALSIEQLVLASPDMVGHQLRFTLKVQGVNPTVEITGLTKVTLALTLILFLILTPTLILTKSDETEGYWELGWTAGRNFRLRKCRSW